MHYKGATLRPRLIVLTSILASACGGDGDLPQAEDLYGTWLHTRADQFDAFTIEATSERPELGPYSPVFSRHTYNADEPPGEVSYGRLEVDGEAFSWWPVWAVDPALIREWQTATLVEWTGEAFVIELDPETRERRAYERVDALPEPDPDAL